MSENKTAISLLRAVRSQLTPADKWSRYLSGDLSKHMCVLQALWEQGETFGAEACNTAYKVLNQETGGSRDVGGFNDSHTHEEVLGLLDRSIEKLEA